MSEHHGASLRDRAGQASPEADKSSSPSGDHPLRKSVSGRLPQGFRFVFTGNKGTVVTLQLSGQLETQDELDAIVTALDMMRDWLAPPASGIEARQGGDGTAPSHSDESPTGEAGDAQPIAPRSKPHER